jgi:hypothetical protein
MKSVYELKKFRNSKHPDLIDALKLYTDNTEPAYRTDTKEIMHCLDNWNKDFEDPFFVIAFYYNNVLIGFSELAYFLQEKFVIVDYLVIDKDFRGMHTLSQFLNDIKNFLREENVEYNYIVAEVGCYSDTPEPPESSKFLIRLLKMWHFGVIKCNYYVPRVGIYDYESEMRAIMMIYTLNESKQIKKETFFQIVNAIYFKYYQRWHNLFVDEKEKKQYDKEIKELLNKMEDQLSRKKFIEINGLSNLFPITMAAEESKLKNKKVIKVLTVVLLFIIFFGLVGATYLVLKAKFKEFDASALAVVFSITVFITLFIGAWIFDNKSNFFSRVVEKLFDKF